MQTQEYKDYMRSEAWEAKKRERIAIDGGCCMCGRPLDKIKSVQVLLPVNILAHGNNMQGRIILISK